MISYFKLYSKYSIKKSIISIKNIIKKIKKEKYIGLLITDIFNVTYQIKIFKYCIKNNIKPIIGCDIKIIINIKKKIYIKATIIIKNNNGYKYLCYIINKSWYRYKIKNKLYIKLNEIIKTKNIIIIIEKINNNNYIQLNKIIKIIKLHIKDIYINSNINITNKTIKTINIYPINFLKKKEFNKLIIINSIINHNDINTNKIKFNKYKNNFFKKGLNIKDNNNINITKKCNFIIKNIYKIENKKINYAKKIIKTINNNVKKNIINKILKNKIKYYLIRLKNEIKVITSMGFLNIFKIIIDIITNNNKIIMGPGRGSGSSSLLSYLLNITKIDPIKNNLIFERFLNSKKTSIPDFDIDICKKNRNKIFKYIKYKYGKYNNANIVTFGKFLTKNTIKDCGRLSKINFIKLNKFIKKIDYIINNNSIKNIIYNNIIFNKEYNINKKFRKCIKLAIKIENLPKSIGIHSGGIVITNKKLYNYLPIYSTEDNKKEIITQYSKKNINKLNIIKFDFLGLKTLTIIDNIIKKTNKRLKLNNINPKNNKTFNLIKEGNTTGIFQLESKGLKKQLKIIKPNNFNDIVNIIALYRPGPMYLLKKYSLNIYTDFGNKIINNIIKPILSNTRGIIIFQEQIILIIQKIFRYDINDADSIRKDLINKNFNNVLKKIYITNKNKLIKKNNINIIKTIKIIKKFSGYSFNKAHAISYSYITYIIAYLKANHKIEFFLSQLNNNYKDNEKLKIFYDDINNNNIKIIILDINSMPLYNKSIKKNIVIGLINIKSIGIDNCNLIIKERKKKQFKTFNNFLKRIKKFKINKGTIKNIILCNIFNSFNKKIILIKQLFKFNNIILYNNTNNNILSIKFLIKEILLIGIIRKGIFKFINKSIKNNNYINIYIIKIRKYFNNYKLLTVNTNYIKKEKFIININNKFINKNKFYIIKYNYHTINKYIIKKIIKIKKIY